MPPLKTYQIHEYNGNTSPNANANQNANQNPTGGGGDGDFFGQNLGSGATAASHRTNLPSYCNAQYPFKVLSNLNQLREQSRFCDVEIIAGMATLSAHRAVLSAASAYFEAMFRPELGLNEVKQKSVVLHTIDGDILHILLDFIYTGRCEITQVSPYTSWSLGLQILIPSLILQSNVQELLAAADMLQLNEVVDGCCEFLCRELHASNALGILRFAEAHNCESLAKSALNFVHANFPAVSWMHLKGLICRCTAQRKSGSWK